jgi:hypothetical protein
MIPPFHKVHFHASRTTADGGLILVREVDRRLGFVELIAQHLTGSRRGKNTQFPPADQPFAAWSGVYYQAVGTQSGNPI